MASVTGFTAARMAAIEAAAIVSGGVVVNNLILTKHDGSTVDAGNVRGPTGAPGITAPELAAVLMPVGTVVDYIAVTAPTNWLAMIGQTVINGQTLYPVLWGLIPAAMKSGSSIIMPDTRGRVSVGYNTADVDFDTIGDIGGAKTATLTQAHLPAATITIDPPLTSTVITDPGHAHQTSFWAAGTMSYLPLAGSSAPPPSPAGSLWTSDSTTGISATVDIAPFQSGPLGSGAAHSILPPFITFLKIIKAA